MPVPAIAGGIMRAPKETPKTFALHWGSGIIAEEAQIATEHHRPTIQLLEFTDGPAKGSLEIRFCFYDHRGRFQRAPLIIDDGDVAALGRALDKTPRLKRLVARLAGK
jgi:hypothetical protein